MRMTNFRFFHFQIFFGRFTQPPLHSNCSKKIGTLVQCGSPNFQKSVRNVYEKCQKSVSCKKLSENCLKCVRYVSEICQIQNSVRNVSRQIRKSIRKVSDVKNVSENSHTLPLKTV